MKKIRVLIVEDESIIAFELKTRLCNLGYLVTDIVDCGDRALESVQNQPPDVVLMDITLKGGMDGIETASIIRKQESIPIIFLTAYLDDSRLERAKFTMPFGYILKPFQERDIKVTLEMALYVAKVDAERKRSHQWMRENEKRYRNLLSNIGILVCEVDEKGKYTYVNERFKPVLGYTPEELIGKPAADIIHPDDLQQAAKKHDDLLQKQTTSKDVWRFKSKNGQYIKFECSGSVYMDENGNIKTVVAANELNSNQTPQG